MLSKSIQVYNLVGAIFKVTGIALALFALFGCSARSQALRIATNQASVALLAELYSGQTKKLVDLVQLPEQINSTELYQDTDLVLASGIYYQQSIDKLDDIASIFAEIENFESDWYTFSRIDSAKKTPLIIVSFNLPLLVSNLPSGSQDFLDGFTIDLDSLREKSKGYLSERRGALNKMGFSPLYKGEFLSLVGKYFGTELQGARNGFPEWNNQALSKTLDYMLQWTSQTKGGAQAEKAFLDKFAYTPTLSLAKTGRFTWAYLKSNEFFGLSTNAQKGLYPYWPLYNNNLQILDNAVYAGISLQSSKKNQARDFLLWMLNPKNQDRYLSELIKRGFDSFGFLGGFSSNKTITEKHLPTFYPSLKGTIPPSNLMRAPLIGGLLWEDFKREVFEPWIQDQILSGKSKVGNLRDEINRWYLMNGLEP